MDLKEEHKPKTLYGHKPKNFFAFTQKEAEEIERFENENNLLPTILPARPLTTEGVRHFSTAFHKAIRNRDSKELMELVIGHTNEQRLQICTQYASDYDRELVAELKRTLNGDFRDLMMALCTHPIEYICKHLHKALTGLITNEATIVELLVPRCNSDMRLILKYYEAAYKRPLVEHVCNRTSKNFRCLMTLIMQAERDESMITDAKKARCLASKLYAAGEARRGRDQSVFNRIFSQENFAQLALVFDEYEQISGGNTIEEGVAKEMSGDIYEGIIAIIECVRWMPGFFAGVLFHAMVGWSTDATVLTRVFVTRGEIDLGNIRDSYQHIYNKNLKEAVKTGTSCDYKRALILMMNGGQS